MCTNFPNEVIKICVKELKIKLRQNNNQFNIIAYFLSDCFICDIISDNDYYKCIEIVLNSFAISVDNANIECFEHILIQRIGGMKLPAALKLRTDCMKLPLNNFKDKEMVKVNQEINLIKLNLKSLFL